MVEQLFLFLNCFSICFNNPLLNCTIYKAVEVATAEVKL